jgi:hypothetical protein
VADVAHGLHGGQRHALSYTVRYPNHNLILPYVCRCIAVHLRRWTRSGWRGARATWSSTRCSRPRRRAWATRWAPRRPRCPSCGSSWACPGSRSEGRPGPAQCPHARGRVRAVWAPPYVHVALPPGSDLLRWSGMQALRSPMPPELRRPLGPGTLETLRVCPGSASTSHARMFCAGRVVAISMRPACRSCLLCFCYAGC